MTLSCERCGYTTDKKQHLQNHLKRLNVCNAIHSDIDPFVLLDRLSKPLPRAKRGNSTTPIASTTSTPSTPSTASPTKEHVCGCCKKTYATSWTLKRHELTCQKTKTENVSNETLELLKQAMPCLANMPLFMKSLEELKNIVAKGNVTTINNNTTTTTTTNNIQINSFGSERMDYVIKDVKFMNDCVGKRELGIPLIVQKIYYNSRYPCNQNVRLDYKNKHIQVYMDGEWQYFSHFKAMTTIMKTSFEIFNDHYDERFNEGKVKYFEDLRPNIDGFCNDVNIYLSTNGEKKLHSIQRAIEETEIMMMNHSHKVHGIET